MTRAEKQWVVCAAAIGIGSSLIVYVALCVILSSAGGV